MFLSKLIFALLVILAINSLLRFKYSEALRIREKLFLIISTVFILVIIIEPTLLKSFIPIFKIRGRAIVMYLYIIFSAWSIFRNHLRINSLDLRINKLVSDIAILKNKSETKE